MEAKLLCNRQIAKQPAYGAPGSGFIDSNSVIQLILGGLDKQDQKVDLDSNNMIISTEVHGKRVKKQMNFSSR